MAVTVPPTKLVVMSYKTVVAPNDFMMEVSFNSLIDWAPADEEMMLKLEQVPQKELDKKC
jgi:hypothetical protein